jgi:excisionase family DNA binding protein
MTAILPPRPTDATLSVTKAARLLGVHPNTVRAWSDAGRLRYYRINPRGDRSYRLGSLQRFLAAAENAPVELSGAAGEGSRRGLETLGRCGRSFRDRGGASPGTASPLGPDPRHRTAPARPGPRRDSRPAPLTASGSTRIWPPREVRDTFGHASSAPGSCAGRWPARRRRAGRGDRAATARAPRAGIFARRWDAAAGSAVIADGGNARP